MSRSRGWAGRLRHVSQGWIGPLLTLTLAMLEDLIRHMRDQEGVWFATHEQIAAYVKAAC